MTAARRWAAAGALAVATAAPTGAQSWRTLESSRQMRDSSAHQVRVADSDTDLDPIRGDPRFQKIIAAAKKRHGIEDAPQARPVQAAE